MNIKSLLLAGLALGLAGLVNEASAQIRYTPPAGPVLPSQLNYFRRDFGLTDPYNGIVAPRRQLDYQLQQMVQQQRADFMSAERQINELSQVRQSTAAPTGTGATFMNYMHYYPQRGAPRR
jgi:hypothetical protein